MVDCSEDFPTEAGKHSTNLGVVADEGDGQEA